MMISKKRRPLIGVLIIVLIFGTIFLFEALNWKTFHIPTGSMEPTVFADEYVVGDMSYYKKYPVESGDLIIFSYSTEPSVVYLHRCIAVAGQTVEIRDRIPFVNGKQAREYDPYYFSLFPILPVGEIEKDIFPSGAGNCDNYGPIIVPIGKYFMLADNIATSKDSRYFGFVDSSAIKGKPKFVYFTWDIFRIGTQLK